MTDYAPAWLDSHPDQVPGRTITQSDYQKLMDDTSIPYGVGFTDGFHQAGGSIVPDPEPTNAERLEADIRALFQEPSQSFSIARDLAEKLDTAGWTKAPGGDDE